MSILLDIADDIENKYGKSNLIYKDIPDLTEKNMASKFYGLLSEDGLRVVDLNIEDEVEGFHRKLSLVLETTANKVVLQGGEFSKKNMSISPLAINFNSETIVKTFGDNYWREFLIGVSRATFKKMKIEAKKDKYLEELEKLEQVCGLYMENSLQQLVERLQSYEKNISVRLLFDVELEHYENANKYYFYNMKKIFSSLNNLVEVDGLDLGYNSFINTNSKKPCLLANIRSDMEEVAKINGVQSARGIPELGYIQNFIEGKNNIYYWEYDTKERQEKVDKNFYIGGDKKYSIGKSEAWQFKVWFEGEHGERKRWLESLLKKEIREPKNFKVIKREVVKRLVKDLVAGENVGNAISSLNNILSFQEWHNEKYGGVGLMETIKGLQKRQDWKGYEVQSLEEYSYMLGQLVYYVNSNSVEARDRRTMGYAYKYISTKNVGDKLVRDMKRYQKYISRTEWLSAVVAAILKSDFEKVDKAMFLAGLMDTNIFYKKKETREAQNTENTIEGEI